MFTSVPVFTGRNEVVAKVMFLHVSVILLTGGVLQRTPPRDQAENPPPPRQGKTPPPGNRLQHTVNERPVRILLECILVFTIGSITINNLFQELNLSPDIFVLTVWQVHESVF